MSARRNRPRLMMLAFSGVDLLEDQRAAELLQLLAASPFAPIKFGSWEPVRTRLAGASFEEAASLLRGTPSEPFGQIILTGRHASSFVFSWVRGELREWHARFELGSTLTIDAVAAFFSRLFENFPPAFAGVSPQSDWHEQNYAITRYPDGGEDVKKVGLTLEEGRLPGCYWLTFVGSELDALAPASRPITLGPREGAALGLHDCVDIGSSGQLWRLVDDPLAGSGDELRRARERIEDYLGRERFFQL